MSENLKLSEWIKRYKEGSYDDPSVTVQIEAGWYDWFCKDSSLMNKTKRMGNIIKQMKQGGKVDLESSYVWFKNNCPLVGNLYDDFRIADLESGVTLIVVQINAPRHDKRYSVYERLTHYEKVVFSTDSSKELVKWLNEGWAKHV
jgi:hypothetical protein